MNVPEKPYSLTYDEKPNYLYARVQCDTLTMEIAVDYLREVIMECRELQYTRLLIERDVPMLLTRAQNMSVAEQLAAMDVKGLKIAVVDSHSENGKLNKLAAAANRGFGIMARAYGSVPDARRWLISD